MRLALGWWSGRVCFETLALWGSVPNVGVSGAVRGAQMPDYDTVVLLDGATAPDAARASHL